MSRLLPSKRNMDSYTGPCNQTLMTMGDGRTKHDHCRQSRELHMQSLRSAGATHILGGRKCVAVRRGEVDRASVCCPRSVDPPPWPSRPAARAGESSIVPAGYGLGLLGRNGVAG